MVGTACWVSVRGDHRRGPVLLDEPDEQADLRAQRPEEGGDGVARAHHQRAVHHVLAGEPAVQPGGGVGRGLPQLVAQGGHQHHRRVAAPLGVPGEPAGQVRGHQRVEVGRGRGLRGHGGGDQRREPGRLHVDHRRQERRVREEVAGAFVARPEEVRHGRQCRG